MHCARGQGEPERERERDRDRERERDMERRPEREQGQVILGSMCLVFSICQQSSLGFVNSTGV